MMEKAVIGGKIAIALGILCIVLVAGLAATFVSYSSIINTKDKANQDYVSTHSHTDSQYDAYVASHHHTDQEFASAVTAPKLVTVNVETEDDWTILPYEPPSTFRVYGDVANAGIDVAYNPKIHVVAYKLEEIKAIDDYVTLTALSGGSWTTFDWTFEYNGGPLLHWTITPEWTTSP